MQAAEYLYRLSLMIEQVEVIVEKEYYVEMRLDMTKFDARY